MLVKLISAEVKTVKTGERRFVSYLFIVAHEGQEVWASCAAGGWLLDATGRRLTTNSLYELEEWALLPEVGEDGGPVLDKRGLPCFRLTRGLAAQPPVPTGTGVQIEPLEGEGLDDAEL